MNFGSESPPGSSEVGQLSHEVRGFNLRSNCYRFPDLVAPPTSFVDDGTFALCGLVQSIAVRRYGTSGPDRESADVTAGCCWRELLPRWTWAPVWGALLLILQASVVQAATGELYVGYGGAVDSGAA